MAPSSGTALTTWDRLDLLTRRLAPPVLMLLKQSADERHFRQASPIIDQQTAALALALAHAATKHPREEPWFAECNHSLRYITLALERPADSARFAEYAVGAAVAAAQETLQTALFKKWPSLEGAAKVAIRDIDQARQRLGI